MLNYTAVYKEVRRMDGENQIKRAYESILHGDYEQAIRRFEEAIAADPDNPAYHHKCSITCMRSGKWPKALMHAEEAMRLAPGEAEYAYHLATIRARAIAAEAEQSLASGESVIEKQIARLKEAIELDPLLEEGYLLLAIAYGALGQYREAAEYAREVLRLNPQHSEAKRLFANFNRKRRMSIKRSK